MLQPTPESIHLVQTMMDDEAEPLVGYLAVIVGKVMGHNYKAVSDLLEERRTEFEDMGGGALLDSLHLGLSSIFVDFLNQDDSEGREKS